QQFCQTVITPPTIEGNSVGPGCKLEYGAGIIIQASHYQWIDGIRYLIEIQEPLHVCKMFAARFTEMVSDSWGCCNLGLILWLFTIKQAEWILAKAHLTI